MFSKQQKLNFTSLGGRGGDGEGRGSGGDR